MVSLTGSGMTRLRRASTRMRSRSSASMAFRRQAGSLGSSVLGTLRRRGLNQNVHARVMYLRRLLLSAAANCCRVRGIVVVGGHWWMEPGRAARGALPRFAVTGRFAPGVVSDISISARERSEE